MTTEAVREELRQLWEDVAINEQAMGETRVATCRRLATLVDAIPEGKLTMEVEEIRKFRDNARTQRLRIETALDSLGKARFCLP